MTTLIATYTYGEEKLEFSFADYAEYKQVFTMHDELIDAGYELDFETLENIDEVDEYEIWLSEYKDVDA